MVVWLLVKEELVVVVGDGVVVGGVVVGSCW